MIVSPARNADVDQPQIEMKIVDRGHRNVGQGDSVSVQKVKISDRVYYRVSNHGDITWEDEDNNRLDHGNTELETALECAYREKFFDTVITTNLDNDTDF